jgi:dipeptidyl aminopeptidase/acylaminoacyl peptidase
VISSYGTWASPLTAARVAAGALRFDHLVADGDDVYWVEGRASEGGRSVVVRRTPDGVIGDVTPPGYNVRTRVHEYGGAAYVVHRGTVYFSNFADQRLYRQRPGESPQALTAPGCFYADGYVDAARGRLLCVREDHTGPGEPVNTIAAVSVADGSEQVVVSGADFYSDPILDPAGTTLAWLQWNHPNMPWDGTELCVAQVLSDGTIRQAVRVAGGPDESIFQPAWSAEGDLYFVSDRTGWWNLYRYTADAIAQGADSTRLPDPLCPMHAEFGKPQWTFSQSSYCVLDAHRIAATFTQSGRWKLGVLDVTARSLTPVEMSLEPTDGVCATSRELVFIGGSPTHPLCIASVRHEHLSSSSRVEPAIVRTATSDRLATEWISPAEPVTFRSGGEEVHAFYYAPHNPHVRAPDGERPPLIVLSHGGPTAASGDVLDARIQFWTSRGFAILDVNYRGSTGFGRAYRNGLRAQWGVVDVADCVNGAAHLVAERLADPARLIIRGGSAGGYTTLAALTFHEVFRAGASHYGVSDLEMLAADTHKFESRYLDSLIGPYPAMKDLYQQRSPIHFTDRISAALILFQGLEDKVVPPNQAEMMAEAVRKKGLPVAYVPFEGEQHGFRKAENIIRCLESELFFYGAVFRFRPADRLVPVTIDNLPVEERG